MNQGLQPFSHFGRDRNPVNSLSMLSRLGQYFFVGCSLNLGVTIEAGIAAIERFHLFLPFRIVSAIPYGVYSKRTDYQKCRQW